MTATISASGHNHFTADPLTRIPFASTVALFEDVVLPSTLGERLQPGQTPTQLLDLLLINHRLADAIFVLAHGLPGREAILWCCLSIEELTGPALTPQEKAVFDSCIRWVMRPVAPLRLVAGEPDKSIQASPIYSLSQAIREGGAQVEAERDQSKTFAKRGSLPRLVIETINTLTLSGKPEQIVARQRCAIAIGIGAARGIYRFAK
jgi:hypothetical protein